MNYLCVLMMLFALSVLLELSEPRKHHQQTHNRSHGKKQNSHNKKMQGKSSKHDRITAPRAANPEEFSHVVSIHHLPDFQFLGAGVVINEYWVLTGAQPVLGLSADFTVEGRLVITLGVDNRNSSATTHWIFSFHVHELVKDTLDYDIALLKLHIPLNPKKQKFAKISSQDKYGVGCLARVLGWGAFFSLGNEENALSKLLKYGEVKLFNFKDCQEIYKSIGGVVTERMLCAYSWESNACINDGGGPLFLKEELIGIISYGGPGKCEKSLYPGVYTRVSAFRKWINDTINNYSG